MFGYTLGFNLLPMLIEYFQVKLKETPIEALETALVIAAIVPALAFTVC